MIRSDVCAFVVILATCVLHISLGPSVTNIIFLGWDGCCLLVDVVWCYILQGMV